MFFKTVVIAQPQDDSVSLLSVLKVNYFVETGVFEFYCSSQMHTQVSCHLRSHFTDWDTVLFRNLTLSDMLVSKLIIEVNIRDFPL